MVTDLLLIFDHAHQSLTICANAVVENAKIAYEAACSRIIETQNLLNVPSVLSPAPLVKLKCKTAHWKFQTG